jgi:hypothetical protein
VDEACQTYPPRRASLGNVFALPDPSDPGLPAAFDGAQWFVAITYGDGSVEHALIAQADVALVDLSIYMYSFNLAASRDPEKVDLYRSDTGYPSVDLDGADLIHSRTVEPSVDPVTDPIRVGRGYVANGELSLTALCTPDVDCAHRTLHSTWRGAESQRHFDHADVGPPDTCLEVDAHSSLNLAAVDGSGAPATVVAHAQRVLSSGTKEVAVPLNDITPWLGAPDLEQSLRIWLPYAENTGLPAGTYRLADPVGIEGLLDGTPDATTSLSLALTIYDVTSVDFDALKNGYWTEALYEEGSSVYFTTADPSMGPTWGDWWYASEWSHTLWPTVVDLDTGDVTTLTVEAFKVACGDWWGFNTGQSADWNCDNQAVLYVSLEDNDHLVSGHTYESPGSSPLIIQARRWHAPGADTILAEFPLQVRYTAP